MPSLSTLSFAAPWLLAALVALPAIWWILRVTPPAPRRIRFPAIAFLFGLTQKEETPAHTPLWLLILRMLIAALIILGLAGPTLNARVTAMTKGPLTLFIDNGWPSARNWDRIKTAALELIDEAKRTQDTVVLVRTAPAAAQSFAAMSPARAKGMIEAMTPSPWRPQRMQALKDWQASDHAKGRIIWLSDGLADNDGKAFAAALAKLGPYEVQRPSEAELPLALRPAQSAAQDLSVTAVRAVTGAKQQGSVTAFNATGKILARQPFTFDAGQRLAKASFNLPLELRNDVARISIDSERSAGAVTLLDQRWQRQSVGLVSGNAIGSSEPLLGELYYVERALSPYAEVRKGAIDTLLKSHVSVLVLADVGHIVDADVTKIKSWIKAGGVLIRFAGPHLAAQSADQLVPVELRQGGRTMGGTLSWAEPQKLGPFDKTSPFYGLKVPNDVTVHRQVLAEPSLELASRTWARLADGTPLVTAKALGKGHIVLFHVTANTDWSNLPISGLFVDMLQRLVDLANAPAAASTANLAQMAALSPRKTLDGFGVLKEAPATATPIPAGNLASARPSAQHPPGLYGPADSPRAFNPTTEDETLSEMTAWPPGATSTVYAAKPVVRIGPWLLVIALLLALFDGLAALDLMGKIRLFRPAPGTAALLLALGLGAGLALSPRPALAAATTDPSVLAAALKTHLAYVITGDPQVDAMSKAGLEGLTQKLIARTALEPAPPVGLNIDKDPLVLYPLIYWPVTPDAQALSSEAQRKLDHYIKTGGMVLFDTQDEDERAAGGQTPAALALQRLLSGLDIPPLTPIPHNHVLTRTFYLLSDFPGRFDGGRVWVEANGSGIEGQEGTTSDENGAVNDGVSPVIIGSNDWAAAWAVDKNGRPIAAVIPGGEHQREMAFRFGINLAIYALTGNYKGDEVHTRELIKRLGE